MSINYKILIRSSLVIIVSLLACGITIFYYFLSIFQSQLINDDSIRLQQTADQLKYIKDELHNFSNVAVIDPNIQMYLRQYREGSPADKTYLIHSILNKLGTLATMRSDIKDFAIVTETGHTYWKDGSRFALKEQWYYRFRSENVQSKFVKPSKDFFRNTTSDHIEPILYITKINDYYYPNKNIGELIFEIDLSVYQQMVANSSKDFAGFIWLIKDESILFEKQYGTFVDVMPDLLQRLASTEAEDTFHFGTKKGHYYVSQSQDSEWIFMAYTPKSIIFEKSKFILYFVASVIFISIVFIILILSPVIRNITKPISQLNLAMNQLSTGNMNTSVNIRSGDEMESLGNKFNQMIIDLKKNIDDLIELERHKQQMQFHLMVSQINPHFIYNTLNSVIYLARKQKHEDIIHLMSSFIHLLQDAIKIGENEAFIRVDREMDLIDDYVKIQKYRYQDIFKLTWDVDPSLMHHMMPKNILQPIVENALLHGIIPKEEKGTIHISIQQHQSEIIISVQDDGVGMSPHIVENLFLNKQKNAADSGIRLRNIGLKNVRERLYFLYGENVTMRIDSSPNNGTNIIIQYLDTHSLQPPVNKPDNDKG